MHQNKSPGSGSNRIFIPKPGKMSYSEMKSFRPISLRSFSLKTLEKLVDEYLKKGPLKSRPLHKEQHANFTSRSVETTFLSVVPFIED